MSWTTDDRLGITHHYNSSRVARWKVFFMGQTLVQEKSSSGSLSAFGGLAPFELEHLLSFLDGVE